MPLCQSAFHCCEKILEINNLKGGKTYFGSLFQRFQPMVGWICCFLACQKTEHHGGACEVEQNQLTISQ
jgi:hypothetical protein